MQDEDSFELTDIYMANAKLELFQWCEETGDYLEALRMLEKAEAFFRSAGSIKYTSCMLNRANIHTQLGRTEEAQKEYEAHVKILGKYLEEHPEDADADEYSMDMTVSVERLGRLYFQQKQFEQSIKFLSTANQSYLQLHTRHPQNFAYYSNYTSSFEILGDVYLEMKKPDDAHACYKKFYDGITPLMKWASPGDVLNFDFARALGKMGAIYMQKSQLDLSLSFYEQAIKHLDKNLEELEDAVEIRKGYAVLLVNAGGVYLAVGNAVEAKKCFRAGSDILARLSAVYRDNFWYKEIFTLALNKMGDFMSDAGMYNEALEYYMPCLRMRLELAAEKPSLVQFKTGLAVVYQNIGDIFRLQNQLDTALFNYTKFYEQTCEILEFRPAYPDQRRLHAIAMGRLAMVHNLTGDCMTALEYLNKSLQLCKELYREYPLNAQYKDDLAVIFQDLGQTYLESGEIRKSLFSFLKYYRLASELTVQFPENIDYGKAISVACKKICGLYTAASKKSEALYFLERFIQTQADENAAKQELANLFEDLGNIFSMYDLPEETLQAYLEFHRIMQTLADRGDASEEVWFALARAAWKLGLSCKVLNDDEQALPAFAQAKHIFNQLITRYPDKKSYKNNLLLVQQHELIPVNHRTPHF
jgi:tetratricopeptide (TPR) repeat protein